MAVPPDPDTPSTPSLTAPQEGSDLTLTGSKTVADANTIRPDLRLDQAQQPGVDNFCTDGVDRSWLSQFLSFEASRQREQFQTSAPAESVSAEGTSNVEEHLDSLAALRDVCANIDVRLARIEEASRQREGAAVQATLQDWCSQTYDRLARVEAAVQRTEGIVAEKPWDPSTVAHQRLANIEETLRLTLKSLADSVLPGMCANIHEQLVQARMALQRTEEAVADKTLHQLFQNIETRLARAEESLHGTEGVVVDRIQELCARMTARFGEIEETVRLTSKLLADSMLPTIEAQIVQARMALQRTEKAVADKTVHELCRNIDARLERTEDRLHRSEGIVAEWFQELSARMNARFVEVDEAIQRIERIVSSRAVEQTPSQQPSERSVNLHARAEQTRRPLEPLPGDVAPIVDLRSRAHATPKSRKSWDEGVVAPALVFLRRWLQPIGSIQLPWTAGLAVPVLVLVAAFAIDALIRPSRGVPVQDRVAPRTTSNQIAAPVVPITNEAIQDRSSTTVMANAPRSTREHLVAPPSERELEAVTTPRQRFVGTLSINSVPSGASVVINGKPAGVTPLRLSRQRAGSHAIQIAHEGFERWSAAVLVPADRLTQVTANLRAAAR